MKNSYILAAFILWLGATCFLVATLIGMLLFIRTEDKPSSWFSIGINLGNKLINNEN